MAENFIEIIKEIRGSTTSPATDVTCIYGDIKQMHLEYEGFDQITPEERIKLGFIEPEATKNSADSFLLSRANHTGTQSADTVIDGTTKLLLTVNERLKLDSIADLATKNSTDLVLLDRSNHTGTQSADTITPGSNNSVFTLIEKNKLATLSNTIDDSKITDVNWNKISNTPLTYAPSSHEHSMNEISSGTLSASRIVETIDLQFVNNSEKSRIANSEILSNKGVPFGYVPLDGSGKINASYLNNLNIQEVFTPLNEASMLLLTNAEPGDVAYRQDTEDSYMLIALPSNLLANWKKLNVGANIVSVNGQTGIIVLGSDNIAEGVSNLYYTDERVDDRINGLLKAGTNVSLSYDDNLGELTISANDTSINWSEIQNKPDPTITVNISGDISGSGSVTLTDVADGTLTISNMTLEDTGTAGTYQSVTTDAQGRVVNGTNPTTLNGYGITDAATSDHNHSDVTTSVSGFMSTSDKIKLDAIAPSSNNYVHPSTHDASMITTTDEFSNSDSTNVQDVLDDLDYAIDVEKGRIDAILIGAGANADTFAEVVTLVNSIDTTNDQAFAGYVLSNDVRSATIEGDISALESNKADKSTTLSGYGIVDAYTKTEVQETLPAIGLDTTNTVAPTRVGQIKWNQDEGTADLRLSNGVTLQLGQENNRLVRASGSVTNGRLCMFAGTIGNSGRVKVKHFTGLFSEHSLVYGIATQDITSGSDGYITINGKVREIDTTGAPYGEVWSDEDVIYAKPNDNGALTNVEPGDDQLKMIVATVIHAHSNGTLEIRVLPFNENMIAKRANKLTTSRNIEISGDAAGSAYFDGSSDINISVSVVDNSHNHTMSNITGLNLLNLDRADKYLAAQSVANMVYSGNGKLSKVQYNNATDVEYEVLTYDSNGKLSNVAHYTASTLRGNTVLSYSGGKLVSAIYTGV